MLARYVWNSGLLSFIWLVSVKIFQLSVSKVQKLVKLYTHAWLRIPYLWQVEVWLYVWSQVVAVPTECFWALSYNHVVVIACVFVCFFSFLFAALVANKVIIDHAPNFHQNWAVDKISSEPIDKATFANCRYDNRKLRPAIMSVY